MAPRWWPNPRAGKAVLRIALTAMGAVMLAAALGGALAGWHTLPLGLAGAALMLALLFERSAYKPTARRPPGPGWEETGERFAAPVTGRTVSVWFNPRTGERRYVEE